MFVNHLPYLPFPPNFPVYIPKDKLANWFEFYVEAMELNFWTGTELVAGSYDDKRKQWSVTLKRDGETRVMHPRHLIFATGVSSIPAYPDLPGPEGFRRHRGAFRRLRRRRDNGAAARRWCSAPAPAAMTWRRNCTRTAPTSPSSSAARPMW